MAISFPSSPNDGDLYSAVGRTWQYDAAAGAWKSLSESNVTLTSLGISNLDTLNIDAAGEFGQSLIPDTNITYDLGSTTNRWRDLYLSGNSIQLGTRQITQDNIPDVDLSIAPEVLEIQVSAPQAGQDVAWLWTWEQSTLPYARRTITNSPEVQVPLYKQGTYTVNNFAAYDLFDDMTQTHSLYLKWIDGAGTDNTVSWVTSGGPFSDSHPDINGGAATDVQRLSISVPTTVTPPTLTAPNVSYTVVNNGAGAYTFSGAAKGDNPNLGPFYRGGTYTINITASGHPFYFTTDNGTNFSAGTYFGEYTDGVTGSRTDSGTITFTVPQDAPDTLYYQCGNHSAMRGAITIKNLAVEVNNNGNYVLYFQHTQEGHKTPVEIRPIPSLVNQMCLVYDASSGKFVPQDLATYVENTPSFENKIREVAGTAELVVEDGSTVVAKVNVYDDSTYLPLVGNNPGDQAFATDTNVLYIWDGSAWQQAGTNNTDDLTEGTTNLFFTDARADARAAIAIANLVDSAPTTLDTLNELAAALGDDPNFATTITSQIGTKLSTSDFTSTADTWLATKDTDDLTEGTNQYFTQARVQATPINAGSLRGTVNNATVQYGTSYSGTPVQGSFFFDSLNQKLKVYTGSAFVDAVPAGSGSGGGDTSDANATFAKYTYTISSDTNSVSGADDNLETLSYTVADATNVEAYVNGVKQTEGASNDYVATTGTSVTFTYNIPAGSTVDIQVYELLTNDAYYLKTETYTRTETNTQISTALASLVDSAPTTLDTLNELAAALGDDPNFATTVTNSIANKLPLSGGTLTGRPVLNYNNPEIRFQDTDTTNNGEITLDNNSLRFEADPDNTTAQSSIKMMVDGSTKLYIANDGDVGIGTDNPSSQLDVYTGLGEFRVQDYGGIYFRNLNDNAHERYIHGRGDGKLSIGRVALADLDIGASTDIGYALDDNDHMTILANGSVGINQTSPTSLLHIQQLSDTDVGGLQVRNSADTSSIFMWVGASGIGYIDTGTAGDFKIRTNSANRVNVDTNGNVAIGDFDPTETLHIQRSGTPTLAIESTASSGNDAVLKIKGSRTTSTNGDIAQILFQTNDSDSAAPGLAFITAGKDTPSTNKGILRFGVSKSNGGTPEEVLRINSSGVLVSQTGSAFVGTTSSNSNRGSILEQGSNGNGRYIRFADGTQICYSIPYEWANEFGQTTTTWTYPAAFSSAPAVVGNCGSRYTTSPDIESLHFGSGGTYRAGNTSVEVSHGSTRSAAYASTVVAIGRWF